MEDSSTGTKRQKYTFAVVIPPSRYRSQKPKPSAEPSRATSSGLQPQAASGSTQRAATVAKSQLKPSSSKRQRPTSSANSAVGEDEGDQRSSLARKQLLARRSEKGKGKEKARETLVAASTKGKEREVVRPAKKPAGANKSRKRRRESRSEDEDDLERSGKETIVEERLRVRKGKSKPQQLYRAARDEKKQPKRRANVVLDSDDEAPAPGPSRAAPTKRALPKFAGGPSDGSSSQSESGSSLGAGSRSGSETDSSSSDEEDAQGNLSGMMVDSDEDKEDEEARELRLSVLGDRNLPPRWYIQTFLQWVVHQTVAPRVEWLEQTEVGPDFTLAFRWIARRINELLSSILSGNWKKDIVKFLNFYPDFGVLDEDPKTLSPRCDACGKKAHVCSLLGVTRGKPYDRKTFEATADTVAFSSESEDSDDEETKKKFQRRHGEFTLGSACASRAELYHQIAHWTFHVQEELKVILFGGKYIRRTYAAIHRAVPQPKVKANETAEQKKTDRHAWYVKQGVEADRCVREIESRGIMKRLVREFEDLLEEGKSRYAKG